MEGVNLKGCLGWEGQGRLGRAVVIAGKTTSIDTDVGPAAVRDRRGGLAGSSGWRGGGDTSGRGRVEVG